MTREKRTFGICEDIRIEVSVFREKIKLCTMLLLLKLCLLSF